MAYGELKQMLKLSCKAFVLVFSRLFTAFFVELYLIIR